MQKINFNNSIIIGNIILNIILKLFSKTDFILIQKLQICCLSKTEMISYTL